MQNDVGATLDLGDGFHLKVTGAGAAPTHTFFGFQARAARLDRDPIRHDVARVKAHAKLANQSALVLGIGFLVAAELAHELARTALGNRAKVGDCVFLAHANAVVRNRQCLGVFVKAHTHFEFRLAFKQGVIVQTLIAQLVTGVRSVRHQFAQEDFFVGVQRMRHQVQQLRDFGLEGMGLFGHGFKN